MATQTSAQQLRNGEDLRFLKFFDCDGAGNFHWVKVAQGELQAGVVVHPNRGAKCRIFDALDGCRGITDVWESVSLPCTFY